MEEWVLAIGSLIHFGTSSMEVGDRWEYGLGTCYTDSWLRNHCKGAPTLELEKEEDKEQMGYWAPPLQYEVPHDPQELGKQKNW